MGKSRILNCIVIDKNKLRVSIWSKTTSEGPNITQTNKVSSLQVGNSIGALAGRLHLAVPVGLLEERDLGVLADGTPEHEANAHAAGEGDQRDEGEDPRLGLHIVHKVLLG